jgi:hypothetical protein
MNRDGSPHIGSRLASQLPIRQGDVVAHPAGRSQSQIAILDRKVVLDCPVNYYVTACNRDVVSGRAVDGQAASRDVNVTCDRAVDDHGLA